MSLSTWGRSAEEFDEQTLAMLTASYWRRRQLEVKLLASQLALLLMGGSTPGGERISTADAAAMFF